MKTFDLRSDTITRPNESMRRAMYEAEVGDDVYGEDPSANRLQEVSAELVGKEAAIFVPSGSMANLIAVYLLCGRGNEVIAHRDAHILHYEMASISAVAGALPVPVDGERGRVAPQSVVEHIREDIYYMPRTRLIEIENSHNLAGGSCYGRSDLEALRKLSQSRGLKIHMDGARVFNAAIATSLEVSDVCSFADTVCFCVSKGLGAPAGSVLCGDVDFIKEARRVRKLLGGGMRQAGVLAAAGIHAIEHNIPRLAEDHAHARRIATALSQVSWADLDLEGVETNIVRFEAVNSTSAEIAEKLASKGVRCGRSGIRSIRMVTSLEIDAADVDEICTIISELSP